MAVNACRTYLRREIGLATNEQANAVMAEGIADIESFALILKVCAVVYVNQVEPFPTPMRQQWPVEHKQTFPTQAFIYLQSAKPVSLMLHTQLKSLV